MIETRQRLDGADLAGLAELERRVVAVDGGRLKLEWPTLRARTGAEPADLLVRDGGSIVAFTGLYDFGGSTELAGAVDPGHRRRGLGTALLAEALALCRRRGVERVLLVVPRTTDAGTAFARRHDATFDHSEHALELRDEPRTATPPDPRLAVRPAVAGDATFLTTLLRAAFGQPGPAAARTDGRTLVVERDGRPVGTLRVDHDGPDAGVYGFAVEPQWQGRGIGRDVLARTCSALRREGVRRIGLEVAVDNERALGLYTSIGFRPRVTEDYWALPTRR